jgi:hypothetical protein
MVTTADVFKMQIVYTAGGEFMESVLHFLSSLTGSTHPQTDALALCEQFSTAVQAKLLACWYTDVTLLGYRASRINNGGGASAVLPQPVGTVGTYSGSLGTPTTRQAALIELDYYDTMATKPRWRQGRIFMGGVPQAFWDDDMWTSDAVTAYTAFATFLNTLIGSSPNFQYGIWSRKNTTLWTNTGLELSGRMGHLKRRTRPSL